MSVLIPFEEMKSMAHVLCQSGLFGLKKPEEAMALMLIAQAEGRHPAIVARDYHIISGRPSLKADAMLARYHDAGGSVKWTALTDEKCSAIFTHPQSGSFELEWTIKMAQNAGLANNPTWKKFPRSMLRSRVISEGIRTSFPGIVCGTYTPEEVQDMPQIETHNAEIIEEKKSLPVLELDSKNFFSCKNALQKGYTMEQIKSKYSVSDEVEIALYAGEIEEVQNDEV